MKKVHYYIWQDILLSQPNKMVTHITDYYQTNYKGDVWIDGYGWRKCALLVKGLDKEKCISELQNHFLKNSNPTT